MFLLKFQKVCLQGEGKYMIPWLATSSMTTASDSTINLYILICHKKVNQLTTAITS